MRSIWNLKWKIIAGHWKIKVLLDKMESWLAKVRKPNFESFCCGQPFCMRSLIFQWRTRNFSMSYCTWFSKWFIEHLAHFSAQHTLTSILIHILTVSTYFKLITHILMPHSRLSDWMEWPWYHSRLQVKKLGPHLRLFMWKACTSHPVAHMSTMALLWECLTPPPPSPPPLFLGSWHSVNHFTGHALF